MARPFSVRVEGRAMAVSGELDLSTAGIFEGHLDGISHDPGDILLDASDLTFVDSSGIRVLFALARRLGERGRVVIVNPTPWVLRTLDLVDARSVLDVRVEQEGS